MYVLLASGAYWPVSAFKAFGITAVEGGGYAIQDPTVGNSTNLASLYTTEAIAQAALVALVTQFGTVSQPPSE